MRIRCYRPDDLRMTSTNPREKIFGGTKRACVLPCIGARWTDVHRLHCTDTRRGRTMGKRETTMACRSLVAFLGKPSSSLGKHVKDCRELVFHPCDSDIPSI